MKFLAKAIAIAAQAHAGQFQRNGMPYILHPLHVMRQVQKHATVEGAWDLEIMMCIAVLHDVLEDTQVTETQIYGYLYNIDNENLTTTSRHNIVNYIVSGVGAMTKREGEKYQDYLTRVKNNYYARQVKLADLRHNSDLRRLPGVKQKDIERLKKYSEAYIYLMEQ